MVPALVPAKRRDHRASRRNPPVACTSTGWGGSIAARAKRERKEILLPDYVLIPILLVLLSIALVALIYWGGLVEERRNKA